MHFRNWIISENTVSQLLKHDQRFHPDVVKNSIGIAENAIRSKAWANNIQPEKITWLAKWCAYQWMMKIHNDFHSIKPMANPWERWVTPPETAPLYQKFNQNISNVNLQTQVVDFVLRWVLPETSDFLAATLVDNPNEIKGKLNNPNYTVENMIRDSEHWHAHIASQKRTPGPEGRTILPLPNGWKWISLDMTHCPEEGDAMGHCGNAGFKEGDNILSLRDPKGIAHLTFIVNQDILGESKGYGNQKPSRAYHEMIIPLLLSKYVNYIKGGGYKPENNFHFKDLTKEQQEQVLQAKPYLTNYFEYIKHITKGKPKALKDKLEVMFNYKFEKINKKTGELTIKSWSDPTEMIEWLKTETKSELDRIPDFDSMQDWDFNTDNREAIDHFEDYADDKNKKKMEEIIGILRSKSEEELEEDEYDLQWAMQNDSVENALRWACDDGYRIGAEGHAYKHVMSELDTSTDKGFKLNNLGGGKWNLTVNISDLEKIYQEDGDEDLTYLISFDYDPPYNGYSGFDKGAYNERLDDLLVDAEREIEEG